MAKHRILPWIHHVQPLPFERILKIDTRKLVQKLNSSFETFDSFKKWSLKKKTRSPSTPLLVSKKRKENDNAPANNLNRVINMTNPKYHFTILRFFSGATLPLHDCCSSLLWWLHSPFHWSAFERERFPSPVWPPSLTRREARDGGL